MKPFSSLVTAVVLCALALFAGGASGAQEASSACQQLNAELFGPSGAAVEWRHARASVAEAKKELAYTEAREERYRQMEAAYFLNTGHVSAGDEKTLGEARTQRIKTEGDLKTAQATLTRWTDTVVNLRRQLAARGCHETPPGGKTQKSSNWTGTYSNGSHVLTIEESGSSLTGNMKWTIDSTTGWILSLGSCTVAGTTATCPHATAKYHESIETMVTDGTSATLSLSGNELTFSWKFTDTTVTCLRPPCGTHRGGSGSYYPVTLRRI